MKPRQRRQEDKEWPVYFEYFRASHCQDSPPGIVSSPDIIDQGFPIVFTPT